MNYEELSLIINTILCVLSFLLAVISVVTVIVSLRQNGKLIKVSLEQLKEMKKERELSTQPVISISNSLFVIERPCLFYNYLLEDYSISSKFRVRMEVKNLSSAVALNVICTGKGFAYDESNEMMGKPTSKRVNILADNIEEIELIFIEKKCGTVFNSLRDGSVLKHPQGEVEVLYMNTSGGAFRMVKRYRINPSVEFEEKLKEWHEKVSSAEAKYKEELKTLRTNIETNDELFNRVKKMVDGDCGDTKEISINCIDIDDCFLFSPISIEEYYERIKMENFLSK